MQQHLIFASRQILSSLTKWSGSLFGITHYLAVTQLGSLLETEPSRQVTWTHFDWG